MSINNSGYVYLPTQVFTVSLHFMYCITIGWENSIRKGCEGEQTCSGVLLHQKTSHGPSKI